MLTPIAKRAGVIAMYALFRRRAAHAAIKPIAQAAIVIQKIKMMLSRLICRARVAWSQASSLKTMSASNWLLSVRADVRGCSWKSSPASRFLTHSMVELNKSMKFRMASNGPGNASDATMKATPKSVVKPITTIHTDRSFECERADAKPTAANPLGKSMSVPGAHSTEWMLARGARVMRSTSVTVTAIDRDSGRLLGCSCVMGRVPTLMTPSLLGC